MDNNNFENVTNAAEPVVEAATAAGAEAGTMPVYTDYSSYDDGEKKGINVLGLVAMILGIVALVLMLCGCCVGTATVFTAIIKYFLIIVRIVASIVAIVLGIIGMKKRPDSKGMAIAGLILGIFGVLLGLLSLILAIIGSVAGAVVGSTGFQEYLEEFKDSLESTY